MIQVHVRMIAPPEKRAEIERTWRSRIAPTRALRGCLDCRLYREVDDEDALSFVELWHDHAAWERHALSDSFREVLVMLELSLEPPEIAFQTIQTTWGLPYLAALQSQRESPAPAEPGAGP
jgi:quinol monooxygenase YgiN